jgi:hypothetical protein
VTFYSPRWLLAAPEKGSLSLSYARESLWLRACWRRRAVVVAAHILTTLRRSSIGSSTPVTVAKCGGGDDATGPGDRHAFADVAVLVDLLHREVAAAERRSHLIRGCSTSSATARLT